MNRSGLEIKAISVTSRGGAAGNAVGDESATAAGLSLTVAMDSGPREDDNRCNDGPCQL